MINPDKIDNTILTRYLKELSVEVDPTASPAEKAAVLESWFQARSATLELADCDTCGGVSDVELDCCPFCGDGELQDAPAVKEPEPDEDEEDEDEDEDEAVDVADALTPKKATKKKAPAKKKKVAKKRPAKALAKATPVEVIDASALDQSVARVKKLREKASDAYYDLGLEVKAIFDAESWKLRRDAKGKTVYTNFKSFCANELGMSHTHAYRLMDIVNNFGRDEIKGLGSSKVAMVLQVSGEAREKLLAAAQSGASRDELGEASKEIRQVKPPTKPAIATVPAAEIDPAKGLQPEQYVDAEVVEVHAPPPPKPKVPADRVTVAYSSARVELPMFRRVLEDQSPEDTTPAKSLEDEPWCAESSENGFKTMYLLRRDPNTGELKLIVERSAV